MNELRIKKEPFSVMRDKIHKEIMDNEESSKKKKETIESSLSEG